jgi:thermostable 8-oxoguanine DNA glycosylase
MDVATDENAEYKEAAAELIRNLTYDDIPLLERIVRREVIRDEAIIKQIPAKVQAARAYLAYMENCHMNGRKPSAPAIDITQIPLIKIK